MTTKTYASFCERHGNVERYRSNNSCVECLRDNFSKWRRRPEVSAKAVVARREWDKQNPVKAMLQRSRRRAKDLGLPFSLTPADVLIPDRCPVFGFKLVRGSGQALADQAPSLDRIDNEKGYVPGNVIVVSWLANRIKNRFTVDQLRKVCDFYEQQANGQHSAGEPQSPNG